MYLASSCVFLSKRRRAPLRDPSIGERYGNKIPSRESDSRPWIPIISRALLSVTESTCAARNISSEMRNCARCSRCFLSTASHLAELSLVRKILSRSTMIRLLSDLRREAASSSNTLRSSGEGRSIIGLAADSSIFALIDSSELQSVALYNTILRLSSASK